MVIARFGLVFGALALVNVLGCGSGGGAGDSEGSYPSSADPYGNGSGVVNNGGISDTIPSNNDPYATTGTSTPTITPISGAEGGSTSAQGGSTSAQGGSVSAEGGSTSAQGGSTSAQGGTQSSGDACTTLMTCGYVTDASQCSALSSSCLSCVSSQNGNCTGIASSCVTACESSSQGQGGTSSAQGGTSSAGGTSSSTGGTSSSTGGTSSSGGGCAALQSCCDAASSNLQASCNQTLMAYQGNDSSCNAVATEFMSAYCPGA